MFVINLNGFSTFVAPPHGERGLKLTAFGLQASDSCRSPPRGAWIEIQNVLLHMPLGRVAPPPRGAWIEIAEREVLQRAAEVAPPHGERGLKYGKHRRCAAVLWSLPPRGAWIEIVIESWFRRAAPSLPPRGAWIEIHDAGHMALPVQSLPPRGAWIEIYSASVMIHARLRRSPHGERGLKWERKV